MDLVEGRVPQAEVLVILGGTGDLVHKLIFPTLYAMAKRGMLNASVVGVAGSKWQLVE